MKPYAPADYWVPSLVYVREGSPCDGRILEPTELDAGHMNIYYKGYFNCDVPTVAPIVSGGGGNFDGGGASHRYAGASLFDLLGVALILAVLLSKISKMKYPFRVK